MQKFKSKIKTFFVEDNLIEDAIRFSTEELAQIVRRKRLEDIQSAANSSKVKLAGQGRCPKCTLKVPCNHLKNFLHSFIIPSARSVTPQVEDGVKALTSSLQKLYKNPKQVKKRLEIQESIQKYKEKKLENELAIAEAVAKEKKLEKTRQKSQEINRRKYFDRQKEKIKRYKHEKILKSQKSISSSCKSSKLKLNSRKLNIYQDKFEEIENLLQSHTHYLSN
jgi:vacuolar-type H+-ATPase subunit I/STV1